MSWLQKLADDNPVESSEKGDKTEVRIMKRTKVGSCKDNQMEGRDPESKEFVRTLVANIPEEVLMEAKLLRTEKKSFKE